MPDGIVPPEAAQHAVALHGWRWDDDPELERWTRQVLPAALERRYIEFAAGRLCAARVSEALLGEPLRPATIGRHASGGPAWPAGVVGSIAHSRGMAGAVAIRATQALGIGLDIEPVMSERRAATVGSRIVTVGERDALCRALMITPPEAITLAFTVKEALFKCLHPVVGRMFYFRDAAVEAGEPAGNGDGSTTGRAIRIRLLTDLSDALRSGQTFTGRVACESDVRFAVVTAWHPAAAAASTP